MVADGARVEVGGVAVVSVGVGVRLGVWRGGVTTCSGDAMM